MLFECTLYTYLSIYSLKTHHGEVCVDPKTEWVKNRKLYQHTHTNTHKNHKHRNTDIIFFVCLSSHHQHDEGVKRGRRSERDIFTAADTNTHRYMYMYTPRRLQLS